MSSGVPPSLREATGFLERFWRRWDRRWRAAWGQGLSVGWGFSPTTRTGRPSRPDDLSRPAPVLSTASCMSKCTATPSPRVAVAYLRASKDEQRLSREAQRAAIEAWAIREGVRVAVWCTDDGVRSVSPVAARPALRAALAALRQHAAALIVPSSSPRFSRVARAVARKRGH